MRATMTKDFKNPADFFAAVRLANTDFRFCEEVMAEYAAVSHSGVTDVHGGFLIPEQWVPNVLSLAPRNPVLSQIREIEVRERVAHIPARFDADRSTTESGGLAISIKGEGHSFKITQANAERVTLRCRTHGLAGFVTNEMSGSTVPEFMQLLASSFDEDQVSHLLHYFLNGSGIAEPLGVLNSPCLIEVSEESGQAADTIVYENIVNMLARIWDPATAVWLANPECYPQLLNLKDAQNQRIWSGNLANFMGRPIVFTEHCHALGNRGDLILGNWSEYVLAVLRKTTWQSSMHVRFLEGEDTFKIWFEVDGAPWWRSPITPRNGENTLSPFVVLEPREGE